MLESSSTHSNQLVGLRGIVDAEGIFRLMSFSENKISAVFPVAVTWRELSIEHVGRDARLASVRMLRKLHVCREAGDQRPNRHAKL